jgi:hypothetical protein
MKNLEVTLAKINLINSRVAILNLKANDYNWSCNTPDDVKEELEKSLVEIEEALKQLNGEYNG